MAKIHRLDLHQSVWDDDNDCTIIRVPGGWIYCISQINKTPEGYRRADDYNISTVFVPYNSEFIEKD